MIIYKATNLINGKCYIGQTVKTLNERKIGHKCYSKKETKTYFHKALIKYGWNNFQWKILKDNITDILMLNLMETFMIMVHHSYISEDGYNMTWGGEGGDTFTNNPHREETREKLRINSKNISEETREKLRLSRKGKTPAKGIKWSKERKMKASEKVIGEKNPFYGKHHNNETILKNRNAHLGKTTSQKQKDIVSSINKRRWKNYRDYCNREYYNNPNICINCNNIINLLSLGIANTKKRKFCSRNCATSYRNKNRSSNLC